MSELLPLPRVEFSKDPVRKPTAGNKGELAWVPVSQLRIDGHYQRDIGAPGKKNIRNIIENFAWRKFSPLVVSPRPGDLYAVIDGQHRAIAAKMRGFTSLPCLILHCSPAEEADAFAVINGAVTKIHTQAMFKAKLAAGDPRALAAEKCATAAGVKILPYPVDAAHIGKNETLACGAIEQVCAFYGPKIATAALWAIMRGARGGGEACCARLPSGPCVPRCLNGPNSRPGWKMSATQSARPASRNCCSARPSRRR